VSRPEIESYEAVDSYGLGVVLHDLAHVNTEEDAPVRVAAAAPKQQQNASAAAHAHAHAHATHAAPAEASVTLDGMTAAGGAAPAALTLSEGRPLRFTMPARTGSKPSVALFAATLIPVN
jgi:hypothetical protein